MPFLFIMTQLMAAGQVRVWSDGCAEECNQENEKGGHQPNTSCMSGIPSRCRPAGTVARQHGTAGDTRVSHANALLEREIEEGREERWNI